MENKTDLQLFKEILDRTDIKYTFEDNCFDIEEGYIGFHSYICFDNDGKLKVIIAGEC